MKKVIFIAISAMVISFLISLGFWQIERGVEKKDINYKLNSPKVLEYSRLNENDTLFQKVSLIGVIDNKNIIEFPSFVRNKDGGFDTIIAIPISVNGKNVIGDFGYKSKNQEMVLSLKGNVVLEGIVLPSERNSFVKNAQINTKEIGKKINQDLSEYYIRINKINNFIVDSREIAISDNHLQYSITWFSLAFITFICSIIFISNKDIHAIIVSFFLIGFSSKKISGTIGSLATIPVIYMIYLMPGNLYILLLFVILVTIIGTYSTGIYIKNNGRKDPNEIVIDEVAGQAISYICTFLLAKSSLLLWVLPFILFRIFDILKPYPICLVDRKKDSSFCVIADDIIAGIFANIVMMILYFGVIYKFL